jgi:predicted ATP-grasp superfamily ATP-dependent carboligase
MEKNVFPVPSVLKELERYVRVELSTDHAGPDDERNAQLEQKLAGVNTLPAYMILTPDGKVRQVRQDITESAAEFERFLKQGRTPVVAAAKPY